MAGNFQSAANINLAAAKGPRSTTVVNRYGLVQRALNEIGSATSSAGAVTLNELTGVITTESLTTAAAAIYTLTITNNRANVNSFCVVSVDQGASTGVAAVTSIHCTSGAIAIKVQNIHASAAFNTAITIRYALIA